jgi:hypothetical protein
MAAERLSMRGVRDVLRHQNSTPSMENQFHLDEKTKTKHHQISASKDDVWMIILIQILKAVGSNRSPFLSPHTKLSSTNEMTHRCLAAFHNWTLASRNRKFWYLFKSPPAVAETFAKGVNGTSLDLRAQSDEWNAVIAEIEFSRLNLVKTLRPGIDHYQFQEIELNQTLIQFSLYARIGFENGYRNRRTDGWPTTRNILVIDVFALLTDLANSGETVDSVALANSEYEEEVLILPVDPLWGEVGYTAQMDVGCLSKIEFFIAK